MGLRGTQDVGLKVAELGRSSANQVELVALLPSRKMPTSEGNGLSQVGDIQSFGGIGYGGTKSSFIYRLYFFPKTLSWGPDLTSSLTVKLMKASYGEKS